MNILNKIVVLKGKRNEILKTINQNKNKEIFYIKVKPSVAIFVHLLNNSKVKKIIFIPSVYKVTGKKVLGALKKSGIKIEIRKNKVGRPKVDEKEIRKILNKKGTDSKKIKKLGISKRAFYYYKKKLKK